MVKRVQKPSKSEIIDAALSAIQQSAMPSNLAQAFRSWLLLETASLDGTKKTDMSVVRSTASALKSFTLSPHLISETNTPLLHALLARRYLAERIEDMGKAFRPVVLTINFKKGESLERVSEDLRKIFDAHGGTFTFFGTHEYVERKRSEGRRKGRPPDNELYGHAHIIMAFPYSGGRTRALHSMLVDYLAPRNESKRKGKFRKVPHGKLLFYKSLDINAQVTLIKESKYYGKTGNHGAAGIFEYVSKAQPLHPDWPMLMSDDIRQAATDEIEAALLSMDMPVKLEPEAIFLGTPEAWASFFRDAAELVRKTKNLMEHSGYLKREAVRQVLREWYQSVGIQLKPTLA